MLVKAHTSNQVRTVSTLQGTTAVDVLQQEPKDKDCQNTTQQWHRMTITREILIAKLRNSDIKDECYVILKFINSRIYVLSGIVMLNMQKSPKLNGHKINDGIAALTFKCPSIKIKNRTYFSAITFLFVLMT